MNKTNLIIILLIILIALATYIAFKPTTNVIVPPDEVGAVVKPIIIETPVHEQDLSPVVIQKDSVPSKKVLTKNEAYVPNKTYSYENPDMHITATFQGYEACPIGEGMCPKFITNDGTHTATVWGNDSIGLKTKAGVTRTQLDNLNQIYGITISSIQGSDVYFLKLNSQHNLFEIINIYQQTGLFDFVEPNWIIGGSIN